MLQPVSIIPKQRNHIDLSIPGSRHTQLPTSHSGVWFGANDTDHLYSAITAEERRLEKDHTETWLDNYCPVEIDPATYSARAKFNITQDPAVLHAFLPYRTKLAESNSADLRNYDELAKKVLDNAQFYQAPSSKLFKDQIYLVEHGRKPSLFQPITRLFKVLNLLLRSMFMKPNNFRNYLLKRQQLNLQQSSKLDRAALSKAIAQTTTPLQDDSTRYMIAASIAELLHRHPEYVDNVLNQGPGRPLRFVVNNENSVINYDKLMGANVIWLNQNALWCAVRGETQISSNHITQRGFISLWSETSQLTSLPIMNEAQRKRFEKDRDQLFAQFDEQDNHYAGRRRAAENGGVPSVGISKWGFLSHIRFLPASLETFQEHPERLCQTEAGRDLYGLYKELFGIDPLNDFSKATARPESGL